MHTIHSTVSASIRRYPDKVSTVFSMLVALDSIDEATKMLANAVKCKNWPYNPTESPTGNLTGNLTGNYRSVMRPAAIQEARTQSGTQPGVWRSWRVLTLKPSLDLRLKFSLKSEVLSTAWTFISLDPRQFKNSISLNFRLWNLSNSLYSLNFKL